MQTPPSSLVDGGSKKRLKGNEALKWLWRITADTPACSNLADYPFRFSATWRKAVMTANVHSAREMAATAPIAKLWADAGRAPFASEAMVRGVCTVLKLRRTVAKGDFTAEMQPFATSAEFDAMGVEILRLCLCAHAAMEADAVPKIIASASKSWGTLHELNVPPSWEPYKRKLVAHAKDVIGKAYAYAIAQWQMVPVGGKTRTVAPDQARNAVHDALRCNPGADTANSLRALWRMYGSPPQDTPTPYATALASDVPMHNDWERFEVPELKGGDELVWGV